MRIEPGSPSTPVAALSKGLVYVAFYASAAMNRLAGYAVAGRFGARGRNFVFDPRGTYTFESIL